MIIMDVSIKTINNSLGSNKALLISFENREEFDGFLDLAKAIRQDSIRFYEEKVKDTGDNYQSSIDIFLKKMEQSYMERPNYKDSSKMDCTCMIFSRDLPELFLAFYDCLGLYTVYSPYIKFTKEYLDIKKAREVK